MKKVISYFLSVSAGGFLNSLLETFGLNVWLARGAGALAAVIMIQFMYKYYLKENV